MSSPSKAMVSSVRDPEPRRQRRVLAIVVWVAVAALYTATAAPGTVFGDPSEYQFIPAIWGIAHPPGYAFYTLLAGLWQRVVAVGSIAFRTNLLSAAAGAWAATCVTLITYEIVRGLEPHDAEQGRWLARSWRLVASVVAGFAVAVGVDLWQQSIHANAHIISAAITVTQLWLLVRWQGSGANGWLFALAFLVGLGVAHHPITVWGIPAYLLFIVIQRPRILREVGTIVGGVAATAAGLLPWLYFVLRSPTAPFGPTDMDTLDGFLRHATAQGLRVNLFHFGLADQADRLQVFVTLLHLQYGWVLVGVMVCGFVALAVARPRLAVLWAGFLLGHLAFTMNTVQDVMAYLLHVFVALGVPLGVGVYTLLRTARGVGRWGRHVVVTALAVLVVARGAVLLPRVTLHDWNDADLFVQELRERFEGRGESAVLISDWEHLTPYFYETLAEGKLFEPVDLRTVYVTGAQPWVESVMANLGSGPVYLTNYRRDVRDLGFRLRPEGSLWRVLEPPATEPIAPQYPLGASFDEGRLDILGYDLPSRVVRQGGIIPITLYARVAVTESAILMPSALLGSVEQNWTTDSRRLTPDWRPGEIIAEKYQIFVPFDMDPGTYPLDVLYAQVAPERQQLTLADGSQVLSLGEVRIAAGAGTARAAQLLDRSLSNLGNQVALVSATARGGLRLRQDTWDRPLTLHAGQALHLRLVWQVLARPQTSYTVFIHLIDAQGALVYGHDYTPLGGAFPSYLWFPKWLPGQRVADPYRLVLPPDLPAGSYWVEVGMYEMGSVRRVPQMSADGVMFGDRIVLGEVRIAP